MEIDYKIIYSKRKTLNISVERDRTVIVRAPLNTKKETIDDIIEQKKLWIYKKTNNSQKYPLVKVQKEFVSGESLLYLGKTYVLEITDEQIQNVVFNQKFFIARSNQENAYTLFKEWYINRAKEKISKIALEYAKHLGVNYNKLMVSDIKYRWGSCSPKNNINFNWRIIKAPLFVLKYIIVHELTHLIELNHNTKFWNIVSIQLPNYNKAKEWLKQNGDLLETDF